MLMEENRLGALENRVGGGGLRKIFRPNRNRVTGDWRRLHKQNLYDLSYSPNIIRVIK